jgi:hypothetical protein
VKQISATAAGLAVTALAVSAAVTGCGGDKSPAPSSSATSSKSSSAAPSSAAPTSSAATDYSNLLIKPSDIVVPGDNFKLLQTVPVPNPAGTSGLFGNDAGSRTINDTIYVYADAGAATQARDVTVSTLTDPDLGVRGGTPTPVDVGNGGTMAVGTTQRPEGPKSKGSVMFTEGKTFVDIEFESAIGDPLPPDFVLDVARKQDAAIKAGLH